MIGTTAVKVSEQPHKLQKDAETCPSALVVLLCPHGPLEQEAICTMWVYAQS